MIDSMLYSAYGLAIASLDGIVDKLKDAILEVFLITCLYLALLFAYFLKIVVD